MGFFKSVLLKSVFIYYFLLHKPSTEKCWKIFSCNSSQDFTGVHQMWRSFGKRPDPFAQPGRKMPLRIEQMKEFLIGALEKHVEGKHCDWHAWGKVSSDRLKRLSWPSRINSCSILLGLETAFPHATVCTVAADVWGSLLHRNNYWHQRVREKLLWRHLKVDFCCFLCRVRYVRLLNKQTIWGFISHRSFKALGYLFSLYNKPPRLLVIVLLM